MPPALHSPWPAGAPGEQTGIGQARHRSCSLPPNTGQATCATHTTQRRSYSNATPHLHRPHSCSAHSRLNHVSSPKRPPATKEYPTPSPAEHPPQCRPHLHLLPDPPRILVRRLVLVRVPVAAAVPAGRDAHWVCRDKISRHRAQQDQLPQGTKIAACPRRRLGGVEQRARTVMLCSSQVLQLCVARTAQHAGRKHSLNFHSTLGGHALILPR